MLRMRSARVPNVRADDAGACREAALRLIERVRRTRSDLTRRLRDRGYAPGVVDEVIERLSAVGLVNDVEYACAFLAGRWGRRAAGWRRLEQELRQRGIAAADVGAARARLEAERGPANERVMARRVLEQTARRYAGLDPAERRRRLWALLVRRGFGPDVIAEALQHEDRSDSRDD
jgi:regulatory protein